MIEIDIIYFMDTKNPLILTHDQVQAFCDFIVKTEPFVGYGKDATITVLSSKFRRGQQADGISIRVSGKIMSDVYNSVRDWIAHACISTLLIVEGKKRPIYLRFDSTGQIICLN